MTTLVHYSDQVLWTPTRECSIEEVTWPSADEINEMIDLGEEFDAEAQLRVVTHNQVGGCTRFFVGRLEHDDWDVFINPEISVDNLDDYILVADTCPHTGLSSTLKRYRKVALRWYDLGGNMYERDFSGMPAADIQTAINYLNGRDFAHLDKLGDWGSPHIRYAG